MIGEDARNRGLHAGRFEPRRDARDRTGALGWTARRTRNPLFRHVVALDGGGHFDDARAHPAAQAA